MKPVLDWDSVPIIFDIPMAARILGVTPEGIKRRCQLGEFPAFKDGKLWRIDRDEFREYLRQKSVYKIGAERDVRSAGHGHT